MQSIPPAEDAASKAAYEAIERELSREIRKDLGKRCKKSFEATLEIFMNAGLSKLQHQNWRDTELLVTALTVHEERFEALNPESALKKWYLQMLESKNNEGIFAYEQEIDDTGKTHEDLVNEWIPKYPFHTRRDLEIWAAEKYVIRQAMRKEDSHARSHTEINFAETTNAFNPNPRLTFNELVKALNAETQRESVRKACARCISRTIEGVLPQPISKGDNSIVSDYQLIDRGEEKTKQGLPRVGDCKYQKKLEINKYIKF